ncbi:MAG: LLM class flavin-dependent oxidoreductase [Candidatus Margulisbacteria bacterium]|nr:LLM class flavin-dependent oxidoreductase [Candidatus Margulisiibacteriota bacterium]
MKQTKFGFCVPIFANPGMAFFRTPAYEKLDWTSIKDTVLLCENLGYDSLFVADHLFLGRDGDIWEGLSLMAALAAITQQMQVIPIHLCNNFRHPGLVAKSIATISHISNGRFELFYDYGWRKAEFDQYGIDFGKSDDERIQKMEEGISIIKGLLEQEKFSFKGKFYTLKDAICNPKPVKKVPIWMGEANHPEMVKAIVKHADMFNSMPCSVEGFQKKLDVLKKECDQQGRKMNSIDLSLETQILIRETDAEIDEEFKKFAAIKKLNNSYDQDILTQLKSTNPALENYNSREDFDEEFMIGTPEQIKAKLDKFVELGVSHFMLWFMDYPSHMGIKLFADKVMPHFKK